MAKHQYGHGTYFKMLDIARRFDMPVDVIAATILRAVLSECYDFQCEHPEDKIEIKRLPPHCKWCWTFVEYSRNQNISKTQWVERKRGKSRVN